MTVCEFVEPFETRRTARVRHVNLPKCHILAGQLLELGRIIGEGDEELRKPGAESAVEWGAESAVAQIQGVPVNANRDVTDL